MKKWGKAGPSDTRWKSWAERNPEKATYYRSTEYHRKWRAGHKQAVIDAANRYKEGHPERVAELRKTLKERAREAKAEAFRLLGGKCARCGFDDPRALQIDHIKAIGDNQRRRGIRARTLNGYLPVLEAIASGEPHNYQLLCANCNWIKRWENHEHNQDQYFVPPKLGGILATVRLADGIPIKEQIIRLNGHKFQLVPA